MKLLGILCCWDKIFEHRKIKRSIAQLVYAKTFHIYVILQYSENSTVKLKCEWEGRISEKLLLHIVI